MKIGQKILGSSLLETIVAAIVILVSFLIFSGFLSAITSSGRYRQNVIFLYNSSSYKRGYLGKNINNLNEIFDGELSVLEKEINSYGNSSLVNYEVSDKIKSKSFFKYQKMTLGVTIDTIFHH